MLKIKKILCATDLSEFSQRLISLGVELCIRFDASLSVFHAVAPPHGSVARRIEFERGGEKEEKRKEARETIDKIMGRFDIPWDAVITYGDPVLEVSAAAEKTNADFIIAASHGLSGFQQFFIGSVVGSMAQTLAQPLLVIPPGKAGPDAPGSKAAFTKIILACSLTPADGYLKPYAVALSEKFSAEVCLVHVMESPVNEDMADGSSGPYDDVQQHLEERLVLDMKMLMPGRIHILRGVPGEELAGYAKRHEVDLIIAGGESHPNRIITTTTAALLRHLPCAVLTVPITPTG